MKENFKIPQIMVYFVDRNKLCTHEIFLEKYRNIFSLHRSIGSHCSFFHTSSNQYVFTNRMGINYIRIYFVFVDK
jgi:hypothetical protein